MQRSLSHASRGSGLLPPLSPVGGGKSTEPNESACRAEVEFFTIVRRGSWNELGAYCRLSLLRDCAVHHTQWSHFTPHCQLWVLREIARIGTEGVDDAASECARALEHLRFKNLVKANPTVASELCELFDSSLGLPKLADRFRKELDAHSQTLPRANSGSPRSGSGSRMGTMSLTLSSSRPLAKTAPAATLRSVQGSAQSPSNDTAPRRRGRGRQEEQALHHSASAPNMRRGEKLAPLRKNKTYGDEKGHKLHVSGDSRDELGTKDGEGLGTSGGNVDLEEFPAALAAYLRDPNQNLHHIHCDDKDGNKIKLFDILMQTTSHRIEDTKEETKQTYIRRKEEVRSKATSGGETQEKPGAMMTTFNLVPILGNEGRSAKARELRRLGCLTTCGQVLEKLKVRRGDLLPLLEESFLDDEICTDVVWETWLAQQQELEEIMATFSAGRSTDIPYETDMDLDAECELLYFKLGAEDEEEEEEGVPEMIRSTIAGFSHMARYIREVMVELEKVFKPGDSKCCQDVIDELASQSLRMRMPRVMIDRIRRRLEVGTEAEHEEWQEKERDRMAEEAAALYASQEAKRKADREAEERRLEEERAKELEEEAADRALKEARAKKAAENAAKIAEKEASMADKAAEREAERQKEEEYKAKCKEAADTFLAEKGLESVHAIHESGRPALLIAAAEGDPFLVEAILHEGADIRATRNVDGAGPMHEAAEFGKFENFDVLMKNGLTTDAQDKSGERPIHFAAGSQSNAVQTLETLKAAGAYIKATTLGERTAMFNAAAKDQVEAAEWLLAAGLNVDTPDNEGTMPIHVAAAENSAHMVEWLIAKGVDAGVKDGKGQTAKQIATAGKNKKVLKVLTH